MNVPVQVPRVAAPGIRLDVVSVAVEAGAKLQAGDRLLDVRIGSVQASIHSEVTGAVSDIRVSPGDRLAADRVMLWIETDSLPSLESLPNWKRAADVPPDPHLVQFRLPPELLPSRALTVGRVLLRPGDSFAPQTPLLEVAMGPLRFQWFAPSAGSVGEVLVHAGDVLDEGTPVVRLAGGAPSAAERLSSSPRPDLPELSLAEFRQAAQRLQQPVGELAGLVARAGSARAAGLLRDEMSKLLACRFKIAVVGEFKRGKSTFLNALAGGEFLPHDVIPCTAFGCRFQYGERPQLILVDANGAETIQPQTTIPEIVAELDRLTRDPQTSIQEAIVRLPLDICRDGVDLIDTPGLNDCEAMNQVTFSILPNVDAAVLLLIPESPLSSTEKSFLADHLLAKSISRLVFVLTAKDRMAPEEFSRLSAFMERQIRRILASRDSSGADETKLHCISSRMELANPGGESSGFRELRQQLNHLIFRERGRLLIGAMAQRIAWAAGDAKASARLHITQLAVSREAFQAFLHDSERHTELTRMHANDLRQQLAAAQAKAETAAAAHARQLFEALLAMSQSLPEQVSSELAQRPADEIRTGLGNLLQEHAGKQYQTTLTSLLAAVQAAYDPVARAVRDFFERAARRSVTHLPVPAEALEFSGGFLFRIDLSLGALSWLRLAETAKSVLSGGEWASSIQARALASLKESFGREIEQQVRGKSDEAALRLKLTDTVRRPFNHLMRRLDQETKAFIDDSAATLASLREPVTAERVNWQELYDRIDAAEKRCEAALFGSAATSSS